SRLCVWTSRPPVQGAGVACATGARQLGRVSRDLAGSFPAAALPLTRSESWLSTGATRLAAASGSGRALAGESGSALPAVAVAVAVAGVTVCAMALRLHPRIA